MTKRQMPATCTAALLLGDGSLFFGYGIGAHGSVVGEVCFNTGMTGYQEVLTDLSYAGQIVTFTMPHIGNTGTTPEDNESTEPACRGLILREKPSEPSNFRNEEPFTLWLKRHEMIGIAGIDTRALTRHIRHKGAQNVLIWYGEAGAEFPLEEMQAKLADHPSLVGMDLASEVSLDSAMPWKQASWKLGEGYHDAANENGLHVVAIDYGQKLNIARSLVEAGCRVTVVPSSHKAADIMALKPDGIFLSNGPADPSATGEMAIPVLQGLIEEGLPIFGICLGHQLLALALGAETEKMHQGHRGANHPVKNLGNGLIEITSQNHGFVVKPGSLPKDVKVTHRSLFDGTIEGLAHKTKPVFSVQYHPESSPGPHDSRYLFDEFTKLMRKHA
ncbi:MAG: glutamine-hydrolyzing carbamoyl-phosphate synthase small subunit [Rickettsiales bacterium]|nr:glutamine-hydrolyzing carbamoyl-phosphate synthase small subunit [Rickettsiales bacterium]